MAIHFKVIRWKNLLSTGSQFTEVSLDRSSTTLIIGENGVGKCVHPSTEIDVKFDGGSGMIQRTTVGKIAELYRDHPNHIGSVSVDTRFGFKTIEAAAITAKNSDVIELVTIGGSSIKVSPDHLMLANDKTWVKAKDLKLNDTLYKKDVEVKIIEINMLDEKEDLYDLQVADVKEYFANGLVSHNSSILDSLCFVLFNKPFRNITKPQLVNSINQKNLLVELEFSIGTKQYKIVRGIKPNVFEILLNGELINQDAAARDYQKYLEEHVLKLNYKSFTQIVILGSASFTPFMQLSSANRREVIEDLLDIKIFSVMNDVLKDKQSELKQKIQQTDNQIELGKTKVKMQQDYIKTLEEDKQKKAEDIRKRIAEVSEESSVLQLVFAKHQSETKTLEQSIEDKSEKRSSRSEMGSLLKKLSEKIKSQEKSIEFYTDNDVCPTCSQDLSSTLKDKAIGTHSHKIEELNKAIETLASQIAAIEVRLGEISDIEDQLSTHRSAMLDLNGKIIAGNNYTQKLQEELIAGSGQNSNIDEEKGALRLLAKEVIEMSEEKATLIEEKHYLDVAGILLKDTGIKTKVIRQYLPVINKLVNKYLQAMDSFIHFELDEAFNETIKSRHRDDFSYASFSEGEKARIDLALLLAWRTIARMKNSANTNLLLLDEVLDGHLDPNGIDAVLGILTSMQDTNIFVISHSKDIMFDKFRSVIKFVKHNDFSRIE